MCERERVRGRETETERDRERQSDRASERESQNQACDEGKDCNVYRVIKRTATSGNTIRCL